VVIADVHFLQSGDQFVDDQRIPMAQVEHTSVAVEVIQIFLSVVVPEENPLAPAHDEIHPIFFVEIRFPFGYEPGEILNDG
jgi:hypothetical protein